ERAMRCAPISTITERLAYNIKGVRCWMFFQCRSCRVDLSRRSLVERRKLRRKRVMAVEQAQNGVRANCVCPGPIDTAWTHKETGPMDKEMEKSLIQAVPLARRGTPE